MDWNAHRQSGAHRTPLKKSNLSSQCYVPSPTFMTNLKDQKRHPCYNYAGTRASVSKSSSESRVTRRRLLRGAVLGTVTVAAATTMAAENGGKEDKFRQPWWPPASMRAGFAEGMATGMQDYEVEVSGRKRALFAQLKPETKLILDVGIGAGPNLAYLPSNVTCIGLDPNEFMDKYARKQAERLESRGIQLTMKRGTAENVPFEDEKFDAVISTLTLCSVRNPRKALSEIQRVLAPGGAFIFLEHVHAKNEPGLRLAQTVLNPLQVLLADGCNLNRDTEKLIRSEGTTFDTINVEEFNADLGFSGSLISRQVSGIAFKKL